MNVERFNFNLFFALDAILNARTLTEAANTIHLTQPAMSISLRKLRAYFNDELIVYSSKETHLTALGEALKPYVRHALNTAREALELRLSFDPAVDARTVKFAAPDIIEVLLFKDLFARIAREAPNLCSVSMPFTFRRADQLFEQDIDIAVVSQAFMMAAMPCEKLFSDTISCLVWEGNGEIGETMTEKEFFEARHATMHYTSEFTETPFSNAVRDVDRHRKFAVMASVYSVLPQILIGTDLVVNTTTRFAHYCASYMPLRVVPCPVEMPEMEFFAQWQGYRTREPIIQWLLQKLRESVNSI